MMNEKPVVLVLMGGPDAERDVSIVSGKEVAEALRQSKRYEVIESMIEKPAMKDLAAISCNVVFPALHGQWGEGGPLQEILEELNVPFVGSDSRSSFLAMDKLKSKDLLAAEGVSMLPSIELLSGTACMLKPPVVIKPIDDGSSVDLRICRTAEAIDAARAELHPRRSRLMAEKYIHGREITVGIVCDKPLPLIEIIPAVEFYDYEAKYTRDDTQYVINPKLPVGVEDRCTEIAMLAYERIGCRDLARADFMIEDDQIWFLELNTIPGFTTHSLVPMAARSIGIDMPALCSKLVGSALKRSAASACV